MHCFLRQCVKLAVKKFPQLCYVLELKGEASIPAREIVEVIF